MIIMISANQSRLLVVHGMCVMHSIATRTSFCIKSGPVYTGACMEWMYFLTSWATELTFVSCISPSIENQIPNHACTVGRYRFLIFWFVDLLCTSKCENELSI